MRLLITGATGFIGNHVTRRLVAQHEVGALVREGYRKERLDGIAPAPQHLVWNGTSAGMTALLADFKPACVLHLATRFVGSVHKPADLDMMIESNIRFPSQLLDAMVAAGCRDFISTGSIAQHCNNAAYAPLNFFAASKQAFADILTYYVQVGGLRRALTLELSDTYGPNDPRSKLIHLLNRTAASGEALGMSPGGQHVDFVHVDDIVKAYEHGLTLLPQIPEGEQRIYAVRSDKAITVKDFVALYNSLNAKQAKVNWGARDYHGPEFLTPWQQGEILPGWKPAIELRQGLKALLG
jgi:nucleoside-diphosphate-sugar epimerase